MNNNRKLLYDYCIIHGYKKLLLTMINSVLHIWDCNSCIFYICFCLCIYLFVWDNITLIRHEYSIISDKYKICLGYISFTKKCDNIENFWHWIRIYEYNTSYSWVIFSYFFQSFHWSMQYLLPTTKRSFGLILDQWFQSNTQLFFPSGLVFLQWYINFLIILLQSCTNILHWIDTNV